MNILKLNQRIQEERAKLHEKKSAELRNKIDKMLYDENMKLIAILEVTPFGIKPLNAIVPLSKEEQKTKDEKNIIKPTS